MSSYGSKVNLPAQSISEDYEPKVGKKVKITYFNPRVMLPAGIHTTQTLELAVIDEMKNRFTDEHWGLRYVDCKAVAVESPFFSVEGEIHLEVLNPLAIVTAIAIAILALTAVLSAVFIYSAYLFLDTTGGLGGGLFIFTILSIAFVLGTLALKKGRSRR